MYKPKHTPVKGLDPKTMVSELPTFFTEKQTGPNTKPKIEGAFLDKSLNFILEHFEDHCKGFAFCNKYNDVSRAEVIISIFVSFFKDNLKTFQSHNVELDFFFDMFKTHETIGIMRQIILFQEPPLFDPTIYFLTQLMKCDDRFIEFLADHDLGSAAIMTMANFESMERRVFKNLVNLALEVLPYHHRIDSTYQDIVDHYKNAFKKCDDFYMHNDVKQRIVCIVTTFADPLPDLYPDFLGVVIKELSDQNLKFAFLTCSQIVKKCPDFFLILSELDVIKQLFEYRKGTVRNVDTLFSVLDFVFTLIEVCKNEEERMAKIYAFFDFGEIRDGLNSSNNKSALTSLSFVEKTIPATLKNLIEACAGFPMLLDAVTTSLRINNEERVLKSLIVLRKLVQIEPKMTTQLFNLDFNDMLIDLLKSDVDVYVDGVFCFFEELLDNLQAPVRNVSNFFLSLADSGITEPLITIKNSKKKKLAKRARSLMDKIDEIEKKHRDL
ncbi:hypothetical protein TRFO_25197 [Tritrichomonas foetus]|uniref:Uncharacterized protein n=1 Tax=Tritrichomonas foetus TaxID=1144522 RepID=A0A1J4K671_9EUKA|nr:hypothetical protein TRFO_25197 [Tritrichomonas foetus]|eukprot:OHT06667.1 hypothetical protein TRFO_25197 [Tritrichomonas foetus]